MKRFLCTGALIVLAACSGSADNGMPVTTALSPAGVRQMWPSYSPDGKRIAYWTPVSDGWQLWVANADLVAPQKLPVIGNFSALWSPDGSQLAAASTQFGVAHTVVVPVAGGDAKRVATGSGIDQPTGWFADGARVAYIATTGEGGGNYTGYAVSLKTGVSKSLLPGEKRAYEGTPSPDGFHIAYTFIEGSKTTIWVADSAGRNPRPLTTEGFEAPSNGMWSPDGREILYESRRTGTTDLWVVPVDGGPARQLTHDVRNDHNGVWSPDGKWVAFLSDRGRQTDVWIVPAAGGEEHRVTDTPEAESNLAWRPGTNELTFVTTSRTAGIWAMDLTNNAERRLTPDSIRTLGFWGSPDGKQIDYVIDHGGGVQDLAAMPVAGGPSRTLVSGGGTVTRAQWSPDGSKIVFISDRGGNQHVWVVDVAGGPPRQLTNWPSNELLPAWSGDGSAIYFLSDHDSKVTDLWKVAVTGGEPTRITKSGVPKGGSVGSRPGLTDVFFGSMGSTGGQLSIARVGSDGKEKAVWERTNAFVRAISPRGDSIAAQVEQPDGKLRMIILPAKGGSGRMILGPNDFVSFWSNDGKSMVYQTNVNGASDIGIFNVADGTTRRLTTTPESEGGAELTTDGKTVLFSRTTIVQRLFNADLSKFVGGAKK